MRTALAIVVALALALAALAFASRRRPGSVDWRVESLYGGTATIDVLEGATKVQAFRIDARPRPPGTGSVHAGPFVATSAPVELPAESAAELKAILLDADTYDWQHAKGVAPHPGVGLWLVRGPDVLEIALAFDCNELLIYGGDRGLGQEDFDAARPRLLAIVKRAFPGDAEVQGLR